MTTLANDGLPRIGLDVSVIIVTFRSAPELPRCLDSLRAAAGPVTFEILVVDNASDDPSAAIAREWGASEVILNRENVGFARAVNQALSQARGRYILVLNPDTLLAPDATQTLVGFLDDHPMAGAVAPRIRDESGHLVRSCRTFPSLKSLIAQVTGLDRRFPNHPIFGAEMLTYWDYATDRAVDYASGACLLLRRDTLDQVGTFDEAYFMYVEEMDLSWRLWEAGWEVWFTPVAEVTHHGGRSAARVKQAHGFEPLLLEAYVAGQIRFWRRYRGEVSLLAWRVIVSGTQLASAGRALLRGAVASERDRGALLKRRRRSLAVARLAWGPEAGAPSTRTETPSAMGGDSA